MNEQIDDDQPFNWIFTIRRCNAEEVLNLDALKEVVTAIRKLCARALFVHVDQWSARVNVW
jgi:transcription elongation factor Elf1